MEKIEYKIEKDKDFAGKIYESYTVEKIVIKENGKTEHLYRTLFPHIDGNINEIDLDNVYFSKPITQKEWKQLSEEYHKAWINGTMTEELCKELEKLRLKEGVA